MDHTFDTPDPVELYVEIGKGRIDVTATNTDPTTVTVSGEHPEDVVVEHRDGQVAVVAPRTHRLPRRRRLPLPRHRHPAHRERAGPQDRQRRHPGRGRVRRHLGQHRQRRPRRRAGHRPARGAVRQRRPQAPRAAGRGAHQERLRRREVGRIGAPLTVSTGSGDVAVDSVAANLAVKTGSGDVRVGESADDVSFSTGSGDLQIDLARRGRFTVKGASGDVRLGIPAGTPVWTDITTVTGRIHSDLAGTGEPAEGQDHVEVRAQVATGDITLQQR